MLSYVNDKQTSDMPRHTQEAVIVEAKTKKRDKRLGATYKQIQIWNTDLFMSAYVSKYLYYYCSILVSNSQHVSITMLYDMSPVQSQL